MSNLFLPTLPIFLGTLKSMVNVLCLLFLAVSYQLSSLYVSALKDKAVLICGFPIILASLGTPGFSNYYCFLADMFGEF